MSEAGPSDTAPRGVASEGDEQILPVRRGKSARFDVGAQVRGDVAMREAMDPANQSLGEALRLSYRLLQLAILGLLVTFLFSGFQSVQEGFTGVRTIFGRIAGRPGDEAVVPGLQPFWPYPVGEMVVFPQKRTVELRSEFWPSIDKQTTLEQATEVAESTTPIRPGRDGSVITAGGDLAHLQVIAEYSVSDPVTFLQRFDWQRGDQVVAAALRRAVVVTAAELTLTDLLEQRDAPALAVRERAQASLDGLKAGIQLGNVAIAERIAPLAVRNALSKVQVARERARTAIEKARQDANSTLLGAAGPAYPEILSMIGAYEAALTAGDLAASDQVLRGIGARLEQADIGGEASRIVQRAKSYQGAIESTLGKDARRLASLAPSWRENPSQLVRQIWLEAMREVLRRNEVEVFSMPGDLGNYMVRIKSSADVMQVRRDAELDRKKREALERNSEYANFQLGSRLINIDRPGRRLDASGEKAFGKD